MTIEGGYYLKARKIQDSEIAHAPPHVREIWDWLLKEANHKDNSVCKRGECVRSYKDIQEGLRWYAGWRKMTYSKSDCETSMKWLTAHTMIHTRKTTRGLHISIVNYAKYQDPSAYEKDNESYRTHTRLIQNAATINKNEKNDKNERIINTNSDGGYESLGSEAIKPPEPESDPPTRKPQPHYQLIEFFFQLKEWPMDANVAKRYLRSSRDVLQACNGDYELAKEKLKKVKEWADLKTLDWSLETVLKRWFELDSQTSTGPKKAYIEGDPAYQDARGDWWVILSGGEHRKWIGSLSAIKYV